MSFLYEHNQVESFLHSIAPQLLPATWHLGIGAYSAKFNVNYSGITRGLRYPCLGCLPLPLKRVGG